MTRRRAPLLALCLVSILSIPTVNAADASAAGNSWRETVRKFAEEHFRNPAWGYSHCVRDYALARQLADMDHARVDDDILFAAAYLHDMAAFKPWEQEKQDHSDVGAKAIDVVLKGTDFPKEKLEAVRAAIRTHMYYREPVAPEAIYLHDADALDWLGDIGVARIFGLVDPNGKAPTGPDAVKNIEDNLSKVPGRIVSTAGKTLVQSRVTEAKQFLQQLRSETHDLADL